MCDCALLTSNWADFAARLLASFCILQIIWWSRGLAGSRLMGVLSSSSSVWLSAVVSSQAVHWSISTEAIMMSSSIVSVAGGSCEVDDDADDIDEVRSEMSLFASLERKELEESIEASELEDVS